MFGAGQDQHNCLWCRILRIDLFARIWDVPIIFPCVRMLRVKRLTKPGATTDRVATKLAARAFFETIDMVIVMQDVDFDDPPTFVSTSVENCLASGSVEFLCR